MNADELRLWREIMGWTQERAAEALGMSLRQYQHMESGNVGIGKRTELSCGATASGILSYTPEVPDEKI